MTLTEVLRQGSRFCGLVVKNSKGDDKSIEVTNARIDGVVVMRDDFLESILSSYYVMNSNIVPNDLLGVGMFNTGIVKREKERVVSIDGVLVSEGLLLLHFLRSVQDIFVQWSEKKEEFSNTLTYIHTTVRQKHGIHYWTEPKGVPPRQRLDAIPSVPLLDVMDYYIAELESIRNSDAHALKLEIQKFQQGIFPFVGLVNDIKTYDSLVYRERVPYFYEDMLIVSSVTHMYNIIKFYIPSQDLETALPGYRHIQATCYNVEVMKGELPGHYICLLPSHDLFIKMRDAIEEDSRACALWAELKKGRPGGHAEAAAWNATSGPLKERVIRDLLPQSITQDVVGFDVFFSEGRASLRPIVSESHCSAHKHSIGNLHVHPFPIKRLFINFGE